MSILLQTDDQKSTFEFLGRKRFDENGNLIEIDLSKSDLTKELVEMMMELSQVPEIEQILSKYWVGFSIKYF